jgi:hypothetical protein
VGGGAHRRGPGQPREVRHRRRLADAWPVDAVLGGGGYGVVGRRDGE